MHVPQVYFTHFILRKLFDDCRRALLWQQKDFTGKIISINLVIPGSKESQ